MNIWETLLDGIVTGAGITVGTALVVWLARRQSSGNGGFGGGVTDRVNVNPIDESSSGSGAAMSDGKFTAVTF